MVSAGTWTIGLVIFGPFLVRKYFDWQSQKKNDKTTSSKQHHHRLHLPKQTLSRFPLPITLPSNFLIIVTFIALFIYHSSTLFFTSRFALRTDLFLFLNKSIQTPSANLANALITFPRYSFGWKTTWTQEGLETLIRRLSSWDGRRLHLLLGIDPFISCTFCDSSKDYLYFSLATRIMQYGVDMFLLGILTLRFDALNTIDDVILLLFDLIRGQDSIKAKGNKSGNNDGSRLRPHRHQWRRVVKYFIAICALCEAAVLSGFYEIGLGQGRWSHWYANRNLVWHGSILFLSCVIFVSPRTPHVPALLQIVQSIHRNDLINQELRANLQAAHLTQQIVWQDDEMREKITEFYRNANEDKFDDQNEETDEVIKRLSKHAQYARVDVAQLKTQSQQAAHAIWLNSEKVWQDGSNNKESSNSQPSTSQKRLSSNSTT